MSFSDGFVEAVEESSGQIGFDLEREAITGPPSTEDNHDLFFTDVISSTDVPSSLESEEQHFEQTENYDSTNFNHNSTSNSIEMITESVDLSSSTSQTIEQTVEPFQSVSVDDETESIVSTTTEEIEPIISTRG